MEVIVKITHLFLIKTDYKKLEDIPTDNILFDIMENDEKIEILNVNREDKEVIEYTNNH